MVKTFGDKSPKIHPSAFVADSAILIGDVEIGADSSVWYGVVMRADINSIKIGKGSNIQDLSVVHVDSDKPVVIGDGVTIGHGAIVHGSVVEDRCLIGMGAVILDGAVIGTGSIVAASALVPPGKKIKPRSLVAGVPATLVRTLSEEDVENLKHHAQSYTEYARMHKEI